MHGTSSLMDFGGKKDRFLPPSPATTSQLLHLSTMPAALIGRRSGVQLLAFKPDLGEFFGSDNEDHGEDEDDYSSGEYSSDEEEGTPAKEAPPPLRTAVPQSILRTGTPLDRRRSLHRVNFAATTPMPEPDFPHHRHYNNDDDDDDEFDFDVAPSHTSIRASKQLSFHAAASPGKPASSRLSTSVHERQHVSFHDDLHFSMHEQARQPFDDFEQSLSFRDKSSSHRSIRENSRQHNIPATKQAAMGHRSTPSLQAKPVALQQQQKKRARPLAKRPPVYDEPLSEMTTIDIDDPNDKTFHPSDEESEGDFTRNSTIIDQDSEVEITRLTPYKPNPNRPAVFCGGTVHRVSPRVAFVSPEAARPGLRRSKRHRMQPLRFWKGECVSYQNVGNAFEIVDVYISNE